MPRLVIRKGEGAGKDHALSGPCIVGRHASANFVLGDTLVSRNHFRVLPEGGLWFVEDMGSTNGTIVNGRRATKLQLADGDVIVVGGTELQFVQKDLFASAPAPRPAVPAAIPVAPGAITQVPPPRAVLPAVPVVPKPAAPVAPKPAVPAAVPAAPRPTVAAPASPVPPPAAPAKPAPPAPPKPPPVQAPIPSKRRR